MQTFLPYKDFYQSAKCLDNKRLGKQRVEVLQLLNSIRAIKLGLDYKGWKNHPCRHMWHNHSNALVEYGVYVCKAWRERGYKDTCLRKIFNHFDKSVKITYPKWLGNEDLHISHKSNLIRKDEKYYGKLFPGIRNDIEYIWPTE